MKALKLFLSFVLVVATTPVFAAGGTDVGIFFGMKNTDWDFESSSGDASSKAGFMAGAIAYGEMGGFNFRSGGYYSQRKAEIKLGTDSADYEVAYLDVPVTLMYSFNDMFSVFGGALLALKISDDCKGDVICTALEQNGSSVESFYSAVTVGINAKFHPNWSGELFYEHGISDVAQHVDANAISAAIVFIY